jgi:hypothetical protein
MFLRAFTHGFPLSFPKLVVADAVAKNDSGVGIFGNPAQPIFLCFQYVVPTSELVRSLLN